MNFLANSAFITSIFDMNDVSGEKMMSRTFCISDLLLSVSKSEIDSSSGSKLVFAFEMHSLEINKWWKFCHKWRAARDSVVTYSDIPSVIILEPDWYWFSTARYWSFMNIHVLFALTDSPVRSFNDSFMTFCFLSRCRFPISLSAPKSNRQLL